MSEIMLINIYSNTIVYLFYCICSSVFYVNVKHKIIMSFGDLVLFKQANEDVGDFYIAVLETSQS